LIITVVTRKRHNRGSDIDIRRVVVVLLVSRSEKSKSSDGGGVGGIMRLPVA
jgi:hypothetical protein